MRRCSGDVVVAPARSMSRPRACEVASDVARRRSGRYFWGDFLRSVVSRDTTLMRDDPTRTSCSTTRRRLTTRSSRAFCSRGGSIPRGSIPVGAATLRPATCRCRGGDVAGRGRGAAMSGPAMSMSGPRCSGPAMSMSRCGGRCRGRRCGNRCRAATSTTRTPAPTSRIIEQLRYGRTISIAFARSTYASGVTVPVVGSIRTSEPDVVVA